MLLIFGSACTAASTPMHPAKSHNHEESHARSIVALLGPVIEPREKIIGG